MNADDRALPDAPATVRHLLTAAARTLAAASSTPRLDAELLLADVLDWSRARLLAFPDHALDPAQVERFAELLARRAAREPVAYVLGRREFYGLDLLVDRRVLVPRPETELLVEHTLQLARRLPRPLTLVDVGTGSGAIAVALAVHLPDAQVYATDIDPAALEVAAANLARHGVSERVTLLCGDLLTPLAAPVDIIVSNPPYTVLSEIDENVRRHEPHLALDGGPDGLAVYQRLLAQAPRRLRAAARGGVLLEIGATQSAAVTALARAAFPTAEIATHRDLAGHERVVVVVCPLHRDMCPGG